MKKYLLGCMLGLAMLMPMTGCSTQTNQVETDEELRVPDEETMGEEADLYEGIPEKDLEELGEVVSSEDEVYQVLVPSGWNLCKNKLDESMLFEMQGDTEEQYLGILVMDELSYGELDLEEFVEAYAEQGRQSYTNAVISEKVSVDVNGNKGYKLRISGSVDGDSYTNQLYIVKYETETVVFTASMNTESEAAVSECLKDVAFSFKKMLIVPPSVTPTPQPSEA